jgi:hypothetical protein
MIPAPRYTILDAVKMNSEWPDFRIPTAAEKAGIAVGAAVKVMFVPTDPAIMAEKIWCEVTAVDGANFKATVANHPVFMECLAYGDVVTFIPRRGY